jgi:hypothetical protein
MFHLVSYLWFRRTQYITPIGLFYKNVGFYGGCWCHLRKYLGRNATKLLYVLMGGACVLPLPPCILIALVAPASELIRRTALHQ